MIRSTRLLVPCLLLMSLVGLPLAAQNVATLRVTSLEAALADVERLTAASGSPVTGDLLMARMLGTLGLVDSGWIDRRRPVALVLPMQGMAFGMTGMVGAFPVGDVEAALAALAGLFEGHEVEEGLHYFPRDEQTVVVAPANGYLIVGLNAALVNGFDLQSALNPGPLPPGNLALDVDLEPVAPMALMGLESVRQQAIGRQGGADSTEDGPHAGGSEDEAQPQPDPQAVMSLLGLYFDFAKDMLNNTSRLQMSVELSSQHLVFHKRLLPKVGSTLAGLVDAQRGGLPELARHLDPADTFAVSAGQITFTPEFLFALQTYAQRYAEAMGELGAELQDEPGAQWLKLMTGPIVESANRWTECYRGDFAGTFEINAESGITTTQLAGAKNAELCSKLMLDTARMVAEAPGGPDGKPLATVKENALSHGGVNALRTEVDMATAALAGDEEAQKALKAWFGDAPMVSYFGMAGDLILTAGGSDAEERFKALVDRVGGKSKGAGIGPATFAPLEIAAGFFTAVDPVRLLSELPEVVGVTGESTAVLNELAEDARRIAFGARFGEGGLNIEFAVSMKLIETFVAATAAEKAERAEATQADP